MCFYVDANGGGCCVFKTVHYQTLKDTLEELWCAVSFKLSGKNEENKSNIENLKISIMCVNI